MTHEKLLRELWAIKGMRFLVPREMVARLDAATQPVEEDTRQPITIDQLMRDVMSWALAYGPLFKGDAWHEERDKLIEARLAYYRIVEKKP